MTSQLSPFSTPSFISRSATVSDKIIERVASDERTEPVFNPELAHTDVFASSQHSTPLSPPASISTRSLVAAYVYSCSSLCLG